MKKTISQAFEKVILDDRLKFVSLYPLQSCIINEHNIQTPDFIEGVDFVLKKVICERVNWDVNQIQLCLISLADISDEHLIKCYHLHSQIIGYDYTMDFASVIEMAKHWLKMDGEKSLYKFSLLSDYLRSEGYAIPFMNYTVDELIKMEWIKLI